MMPLSLRWWSWERAERVGIGIFRDTEMSWSWSLRMKQGEPLDIVLWGQQRILGSTSRRSVISGPLPDRLLFYPLGSEATSRREHQGWAHLSDGSEPEGTEGALRKLQSYRGLRPFVSKSHSFRYCKLWFWDNRVRAMHDFPNRSSLLLEKLLTKPDSVFVRAPCVLFISQKAISEVNSYLSDPLDLTNVA